MTADVMEKYAEEDDSFFPWFLLSVMLNLLLVRIMNFATYSSRSPIPNLDSVT